MICPPGVYRAQSDTALLSGDIGRLARDRHVLDVGSGSGALALAAARAGSASVTAVDLSWRSVAATWLNARLHGATVSVRRGDLYAPVADRRFDLVVANPPYVPAATATLPRYTVGRCWDGGLDGRVVLDRLCDGARDRLTADGVLLLVHSAVCDADRTLARLAAAGMDGDVVARRRVPFGPVMRARATMLQARGLIEAGQRIEELVVVEARRAR